MHQSHVPYMDIREFRDKGYLRELNRQFLHPLGLALEVIIDDDGNETIGGIRDYRDDPEGVYYGDINDEARIKADFVAQERAKRERARVAAVGDVVQPL